LAAHSEPTDVTKNPEQRRPSIVDRISVPQEVHLRQMRVRPALVKLDAYLRDATGAGHPRVRVIHGKSGGVMKAAVREHMTGHPMVKRYYNASPAEGNGGVTIAVLRGSAP
jgi:DNA mismatch repair protein MutS2